MSAFTAKVESVLKWTCPSCRKVHLEAPRRFTVAQAVAHMGADVVRQLLGLEKDEEIPESIREDGVESIPEVVWCPSCDGRWVTEEC